MWLHYEWPCPCCPMIYPNRRALGKHKKECHISDKSGQVRQPGGKCKYCGRECIYLNVLRNHENHCQLNPSKLEYKGHPQTEESKQKIRLASQRCHKMGGYRYGSGRGKKGWYCGYFCDSSWELAFVIYNIEHSISFSRNTDTFDYMYKGKSHKYLPDFVINNVYYEIKGYKTEQWNAKYDQFPYKDRLVVIDKISIIPYIDYVITKYGKDYIRLYERN